MAANDNEQNKNTSISSKFNQSLLTLFLVLVLILIPIMYYLTKTQVLAQANKELTLLVDMVKSVRNVVREETRPHFMPQGEFFPVVVSSTVMAKTVAEKFAVERPEYYIKIFSDNPLNPEDYPDELELEMLQRFRADGEVTSIVETGTIRGQQYLLSAAPARVTSSCLLCHGDPDRAPQAISRKYGKQSGYNWEVGSVIGGSAVGVPLDNINAIAVKRTLYALGVLTFVFLVLYVYINTIVRRNIITPVRDIADKAKKISQGDLGEPIETERDDEIGDLANSFEMMRRSFISLVRRIKANNE